MNVLGVCSWSLRPASPGDLADSLMACGVSNVQLALEPLRTGAWTRRDLDAALSKAGVRLLSGMMAMHAEDYSTLESIRKTGGVRPDAHWPSNLKAARAAASLARDLGLSLVTFHAGFLPERPHHPERATMLERLRTIADCFADQGVEVALETGQEDAQTLLAVLDELDRPRVGVNFDPANMILYGMGDPVDALQRLAPYVKQIHIKDAIPAGVHGEWGTEVVVGTGAVDWDAFLAVVASRLPGVPMVIEREADETRVDDIRAAVAFLHSRGVVDDPQPTMGA